MAAGRWMILVALAAVASSASAQRDRDRGRFPNWSQPDLRPPVVVGESSGPVQLQMGQMLEVRLPVQAGTGYSWSVDADNADNLEFIDQSTLQPWGAPQLMGGSQVQRFTYRAIGPGAATLRFAYRRPWLGGVPPAQTVVQQVTVGPWLR